MPSDRFRFRAWDPIARKMRSDLDIGEFASPGTTLHELISTCQHDGTLMQSTGLCDKNGKEIFEGDILRFWTYGCKKFDVGAVHWHNCAWRIGPRNLHYIISDSGVVIGNIYENSSPELA